MENLYLKYGLVSRTYYKKSLIMASIIGFKSKFFYDHVAFLLKCEIDHAVGGKLRNKNADESWEIIKNLALYDHKGPSPQPQALGTTFEARVRDYMAAHSERMERFENTFFKQREEINGRMTEMFRLLKELTTSRAPEKVLIREETKFPVTKNVNSISLARGEEERSDKTDETLDNTKKPTHRINEELIKGLFDNNRFNDSLSRARVGKMPIETDIRLSLASHSYIYPLGIVEDVLVEVAEHVYPIDFVILDIKENKKRPFILGTPFLTTAKVAGKFDKGTITLRSGKSKISFHRASPRIGRKDKASHGKGDGVQPMDEQKLQGQASHPNYKKGGMEDEVEVT
ncbi:MAK10-like protein [Tanacetum coccineum]